MNPTFQSDAERQFAHLTRLQAIALSMSQDQVDAVAFVTYGDVGGWTPEQLATCYTKSLDYWATKVAEERREAQFWSARSLSI